MKVLLLHSVFGKAMDAFNRNLLLQEAALGEPFPYDRLLVAPDRDVKRSYPFDVITDGTFNHDKPCVSRLRNLALDYATEGDWDYTIILDADCIILDRLEYPPPTGIGYVPSHFSKPGEGLEDYLRASCGWQTFTLILSRAIFSGYRFDESFWGHGNEDNEFVYHQLWFDGIYLSGHNVRGVHVWHPQRTWATPQDLQRNRRIYLDRLVDGYARTGRPLPPHLTPEEQAWVKERAKERHHAKL